MKVFIDSGYHDVRRNGSSWKGRTENHPFLLKWSKEEGQYNIRIGNFLFGSGGQNIEGKYVYMGSVTNNDLNRPHTVYVFND